MKEGPDLSRVAALIGEPARAAMLAALMDGRALTAGELGREAGVAKPTASGHLGQLLAARLVARDVQGRHHYYRLDGADVALALEALMGVAARRGATRIRPGPKDPAMRKARVCYDHLAGEMGVFIFDRLRENGGLAGEGPELAVTKAGWRQLADLGLEQAAFSAGRRATCRACLDWSVRRHHLAGAVGAGVLQRIFQLKWARRDEGSRVVALTPAGESALRAWLA